MWDLAEDTQLLLSAGARPTDKSSTLLETHGELAGEKAATLEWPLAERAQKESATSSQAASGPASSWHELKLENDHIQ